jgi:hypothetical protein
MLTYKSLAYNTLAIPHFSAYNLTSILTYKSLAYNTLAILYFGAYNLISILTLSLAQASYPLYNRIAPFNNKLIISFYYFIRLIIASNSLL